MYSKTYILLLSALIISSCQSELYKSEIQENSEVLKAMKSVNDMEQTMFGLSDNSVNTIIYFDEIGVTGRHTENKTGKHTIKVDPNTDICKTVQHELLHHVGYKHTELFYSKLKELNPKC